MPGFTKDWANSRISAGSRLTVRLERTGGYLLSPDDTEIAQALGESTAVTAHNGSCALGGVDPCGEYHVPIVVHDQVVLGDVLPRVISAPPEIPFVPAPGQWEVTGARYDGVASESPQSGGGETTSGMSVDALVRWGVIGLIAFAAAQAFGVFDELVD